jgi:hypothetical protein
VCFQSAPVTHEGHCIGTWLCQVLDQPRPASHFDGFSAILEAAEVAKGK